MKLSRNTWRSACALPLVICLVGLSACERSDSIQDAGPPIPYVPTDVGLVFDQATAGARYVSMGDSAAAGPLIIPHRSNPLSCFRSDANFPSLLAEGIRASRFQDMTCSSALTDHLFAAQGSNPPQLDALRPDTSLVTLGPIGANDLDATSVFLRCLATPLSGLVPSCVSNYPVTEGRDQFSVLLEHVAENVGAALKEIHRRSPRADVYVVGYGLYFPEDGCFPTQPYSAESANYIQELFNRVNDVLRQQADLHGAQYVSTQEGDANQHTTCAQIFQRWIVGLIPDAPAFPFHPSALGMEAVAGILSESVGQ